MRWVAYNAYNAFIACAGKGRVRAASLLRMGAWQLERKCCSCSYSYTCWSD